MINPQQLIATSLMMSALGVGIVAGGTAYAVSQADSQSHATEQARIAQVAQVKAEIEDRENETLAREASNKEYRIAEIRRQADEELQARIKRAQGTDAEVNAGNMWKNQQIDAITGNNALSKVQGVNYYNGRRETWYSSNVLYHKDTAQWTLDANGVYRDSDGYVVIASSDHSFGDTVETSHGAGKVYDTGCPNGTTDIYVNW